MRENEAKKLVVYGASNAAGWSESHDVGYDIAKIMEAGYSRPSFVTSNTEKIIIDLSKSPEIDEGKNVVNAALPGDTALELLEGFEERVVSQQPTHVFIWTGLNDPVLAVSLLHPSETREDLSYDEADILKREMTKVDGIDGKLKKSSEIITGYIEKMVEIAKVNGINPLIGTLPSFASTLAARKEKIASYLIREGIFLIKDINSRLTSMEKTSIVDAYNAVLDQASGLVKAEFSFGANNPRFSGDILHLNTLGHIKVAAILGEKLFNKNIEIIPPK